MEVVEVCTKPICRSFPPYRSPTPPCMSKNRKVIEQCEQRYIQPPRTQSYAPKKIYKVPSKAFDANTTYHVSYLNQIPQFNDRTQAIRPRPALQIIEGKFEDGTTNRLSYQPVRDVQKPQPIVPRRRKLIASGPMQSTTTVQKDFGPKYVEKPNIVIPSDHIRSCSGQMDSLTIARLSFVSPGVIKPPESFKPIKKYSPPDEPIRNETTHTLSYQPFRVEQRELHPWASKSSYKPPQTAMSAYTTYSKSYMRIDVPTKVKSIHPISNVDWFQGRRKFNGRSCYRDTYIPRFISSKCLPVIHPGNIKLSDKKMSSDTTAKLSYQSFLVDKVAPIRPKLRNLMTASPMESTTTHRLDFQFKTVEKPEIILPCDNIKHSKKPFETLTTSAMSFMNHGCIERSSSFKPSLSIKKSSGKVESDTVNKLSYQPWTPATKEFFPWTKKSEYQQPREPMAGDSVYNMSFAPPGYFIEVCNNAICPNPAGHQNSLIPNSQPLENCLPNG